MLIIIVDWSRFVMPFRNSIQNYSNIKPVRPLAAQTGRQVSQILCFYSLVEKENHHAGEMLVSESATADTAIPFLLELST